MPIHALSIARPMVRPHYMMQRPSLQRHPHFGSGEFADQIEQPPLFLEPKISHPVLRLFQTLNQRFILPNQWYVQRVQVNGLDRLRQWMRDGHPVLLSPNHPGLGDVYSLLDLGRQLRRPIVGMGTVAIFRLWPMDKPGILQRLGQGVLRRLGMFPVHNDMMDTGAVRVAVNQLKDGSDPVTVFSEGFLTYRSRHIAPLNEGSGFIGLQAQLKRQKEGKGDKSVLMVPVGIQIRFVDNIVPRLTYRLHDLEKRLGLPAGGAPPIKDPKALVPRVERVWHHVLDHMQQRHPTLTGPVYSADKPLSERHRAIIEALVAPSEAFLQIKPEEGAHVWDRIRTVRHGFYARLNNTSKPLPKPYIRAYIVTMLLPMVSDAWELNKLVPGDLRHPKLQQDQLVETLYQLERLATGKSSLATLGPRLATLTIGNPINVADYIPAYTSKNRKAKEQALRDLTRDLHQGMQSLVNLNP